MSNKLGDCFKFFFGHFRMSELYPVVNNLFMFRFSKKTTQFWQNLLLDFKWKVQVFREDHKNLVKSSIWHLLEDIVSRRNIYQIFEAFLKTWTLYSKHWINWEVSPNFCSLLWKLKLDLVKGKPSLKICTVQPYLETIWMTLGPNTLTSDGMRVHRKGKVWASQNSGP